MCRCRNRTRQNIREITDSIAELRMRSQLLNDDDPNASLKLNAIEGELAAIDIAISAVERSHRNIVCCNR